MKLFQQLLVAPAALGLVAPMGAMAADLNLDGVNKYAASEEQVTSISQFSDVYPTDWAYQALSNLIERYGCVAGYPNGTFGGNRAMSRYEAAALLNACLDRVTEMTDEIKRLVKAFEKELAIVKARVDGLEAKVGELEATQFSTTTKLKGKVRFVMGSANRGDGYVRFGRLKDTLNAAALYGHRAYDGSTGGLQDRAVNGIKSGKSQGTAYYYYLRNPDYGTAGTQAANGVVTGSGLVPNNTKLNARQLAFSTSWTGIEPSVNNANTSNLTSGGAALYTRNTANNTLTVATAAQGSGNTLLVPSINSGGTGASTFYTPNRSRLSIYTKDGVQGDNSFFIAGQTANVVNNQVLVQTTGLKNGVLASSYLRARNFYGQDKYGNTQSLRVQTSASGSSNYKSANIQLDKADYGALINLANKARKVKAYSYYQITDNSQIANAGAGAAINGVLTSKAAGAPDPISLGNITRAYVGTTVQGTTATTEAVVTGLVTATAANGGTTTGGFVVAPGGFVQNNNIYNDVADYLIAEYGSLNAAQRNTKYVKKAAQLFVRSLAAYPANKNQVADKNAFTFGHDAQLNFNTSFTGKDNLQFRLRSNNIYSFAKRAGAPFADLAYDGSAVAWPSAAKANIFVDKLYYRFPVSDWGVIAAGTRAPQDSFLPSRGTMYTKDALLEFFNTSAGVFPSYTGSGAGVSIGQFGNKKLKMANGSWAFGLGYLAAEADSANPDSYDYLSTGLFGEDTRFRLPAQIAWGSNDKKWLFTANYAYERGGNSMGKVGTALSANPFGYANLIESNQWGFTLAYEWDKQFSITGSYGGASVNSRYDSSVLGIKMTDAGDTATMNSWMIGLNFKDVFLEGNKAGFAIGGVPTVGSNDSGWGQDQSMPVALETWYQFQVSDNISVTPGVFWIAGQNAEKTGNYGQVKVSGSNGDVWGGVIKTEFKF